MVKSSSPQKTARIAAIFARKTVKKPLGKNALVIALSGELGAGKTAFSQGFARALGIKKTLLSPTFILMRSYKLMGKKYTKLVHIDAYRLKKTSELAHLGFKSVLADPENIVLIEWPEILKEIMPRNTIWINFRHGRKGNERVIGIGSG